MPSVISGEHTGLWGVYLATAQLPNTSGATIQTKHLRKGHLGICIISGTPGLYICTTATEGAGVWAQLMHTGSSVTGNLTLSGTLSAEQVTSTDDATVTDDLAITGLLTVGETANVVGNFSVATNKFTVTAASGNTAVAGTANVVGDFSVNTNKFTANATSGNCLAAGTLTSTGTLAATAAATVGTTLGVTGATTLTGGIVQATAYSGAHNAQITGATNGTDTACADGTQFVTSIFVPANITLTGVQWLIGSVGGTDRHYVVLYNAAGTNVANSDLTSGGAVVGTAANLDVTAFTATYAAVGPAMYYVGVSVNGSTAKIRTLPVYLGASCFGGTVAQTHGTVAAITPPTTFTADQAPYVVLY